MPDNPASSNQQPPRFYGFADSTAFPEFSGPIKPHAAPPSPSASPSAEELSERALREAQILLDRLHATDEALESAPSGTMALVHVPPGRQPSEDAPATLPKPLKTGSRGTRRSETRKRRKKIRKTPPVPPRQMHEAHCGICRSNVRDEIDEEFIDWHRVTGISQAYQIDRRAIYRHAHATGLFARRARNLREALGHIIQRAENADVNGDTIVRAVRTFAQINKAGEWAPPPKHVIISSGGTPTAQNSAAPARLPTDTPSQVKTSGNS